MFLYDTLILSDFFPIMLSKNSLIGISHKKNIATDGQLDKSKKKYVVKVMWVFITREWRICLLVGVICSRIWESYDFLMKAPCLWVPGQRGEQARSTDIFINETEMSPTKCSKINVGVYASDSGLHLALTC